MIKKNIDNNRVAKRQYLTWILNYCKVLNKGYVIYTQWLLVWYIVAQSLHQLRSCVAGTLNYGILDSFSLSRCFTFSDGFSRSMKNKNPQLKKMEKALSHWRQYPVTPVVAVLSCMWAALTRQSFWSPPGVTHIGTNQCEFGVSPKETTTGRYEAGFEPPTFRSLANLLHHSGLARLKLPANSR